MNEQNDLTVAGILNLQQDVEVDTVKVAGLLKVKGNLTCHELESAGMMTILGNCRADHVNCSGAIKVTGVLKTNQLLGAGLLKGSQLEAETVRFRGKIKMEKTINCDTFHFEVSSPSHVDTIEASRIVVTNKTNRKRLKVGNLSADVIELDHVFGERIFGDQVIIGPNCLIKYIEYQTTIEIDPSSKVITTHKEVRL
jgi:cytoskeletal protein CcmA (bactofilin family)